jgi:hypothetical protein
VRADASAQTKEREPEIARPPVQAGGLIRLADPSAPAELAGAASTILREEALTGQARQQPLESQRRRRKNPLAAGIGMLMVGVGLALLIPVIGVAMMACGVGAIVWGIIISVVPK